MLVGAFGSEEGQGGASVSVEGVQMRGQIRGPGVDGQKWVFWCNASLGLMERWGEMGRQDKVGLSGERGHRYERGC